MSKNKKNNKETQHEKLTKTEETHMDYNKQMSLFRMKAMDGLMFMPRGTQSIVCLQSYLSLIPQSNLIISYLKKEK